MGIYNHLCCEYQKCDTLLSHLRQLSVVPKKGGKYQKSKIQNFGIGLCKNGYFPPHETDIFHPEKFQTSNILHRNGFQTDIFGKYPPPLYLEEKYP